MVSYAGESVRIDLVVPKSMILIGRRCIFNMQDIEDKIANRLAVKHRWPEKAQGAGMGERHKCEMLRHKAIYKAARWVIPLVLKKYSFTTDKLARTEGNYIVLANHLTEVDMLMVAMAFPRHMYFVAGEHLLRSKYGKLIRWSQDPVFEAKGASSLPAVMEILRRAKCGENIMIFPEGSRSFHGETVKQPESLAKLVKRCGCGLVTYHIEGGYFVAPRWAYTFRVGPMKGSIVKVRSAQEVAEMSNRELTEAINRELYENAHVTQRRNRFRYQGERLAEGIENYLVKCSCCGSFDSLTSQGNEFRCQKCGLFGIYTEEGFLRGKSLRYDNVYDWGAWAEAETERHILLAERGQECFRDSDVTVFEITEEHERKELLTGEVIGYRDRMALGEYSFDFQDISAMSMLYYGKTLLFTCGKRYFGITGERFHAIKYQKLYDHYRNGCDANEERALESTQK